MSNFAARLDELVKAGNAYELSRFLTEKTYAIRDLVVAVDLQNRQWHSPLVSEALAKLEEA